MQVCCLRQTESLPFQCVSTCTKGQAGCLYSIVHTCDYVTYVHACFRHSHSMTTSGTTKTCLGFVLSSLHSRSPHLSHSVALLVHLWCRIRLGANSVCHWKIWVELASKVEVGEFPLLPQGEQPWHTKLALREKPSLYHEILTSFDRQYQGSFLVDWNNSFLEDYIPLIKVHSTPLRLD